MSTVTFRGGRFVTPEGIQAADIVVSDGVISALTAVGEGPASDHTVACDGLLVMPGMVDTHVHLMDPGATDREDFPTGTRAAAARGATTIVEHTHAHPIRQPVDLTEKVAYLKGRANVDYGLAAHVWPDRVNQIAPLWRAGVTFFKIFTCTTHGVPGLDPASLRSALGAIGAIDGRTLIHCEDESITAEAERALREGGRVDPGLLGEWRNREAEEVAVAAAAILARFTDVAATLAHVSTPAVLDIISAARSWGADVVAEACPQYFALNEDEVNSEGALRKFTPPARIRNERDRLAMWRAVNADVFSHFSTDHAPSTIDQKLSGDIWDAPFGLPGLDTTYPFLIDAALNGTIDLPTVAQMAAAAPAVRYGLAPRKGRIARDADADLVLVDPEGSWVVQRNDILSKAGWSPYEGRTFRGRIVASYLRGEEVARDGVAHDARTGRFLTGAGHDPDRI